MLTTAALAGEAQAYAPLKLGDGPGSSGNGPVISAEIVPLFWGNWTATQRQNIRTYLDGFAGYMSGVGAPTGTEPVAKQYGVWGARRVSGDFFTQRLPGFPAQGGTLTGHLVTDEIHDLQQVHSQTPAGFLPATTVNRVFIVFTNGFKYDFSDVPGLSGSWCAFHQSGGVGTHYAVVPLEKATGGNCTIPLMSSHELLEAMTDPVIAAGWVTTEGTFGAYHNEGSDSCFVPTNLPFGDVEQFADNSISGCASFTRQTTSHIGVAKDGTNTFTAFVTTKFPGTIAQATFVDGSWWTQDWITDGSTINFVGAPAVVSPSPGRLDVFVRGAEDGLIHHASRLQSGGQWTWSTLPNTGFGEPSAVSWGPNRIDIVSLNSEASLAHYWSADGTKFSFETMGAQIIGPPKIFSRGKNLLDIYAFSLTSSAIERSWNGSAWSSFTAIVPGSNHMIPIPMSVTTSNPSVNKFAFAAGTGAWGSAFSTSSPYAVSVNGQWNGGWASYGPSFGALGTVALPGAFEVAKQDIAPFQSAWSYSAQHYTNSTAAFSARMDLGGTYTSPPVIVLGADGNRYVLGIGQGDNCLWYTKITGPTSFSGPFASGVCNF